ncbi:MAG: hypothetical protein IRZ11_09130 [Clostridia bacterium]|nr:hypothetical protein [Clostridia bacterium]
MDVPEVRGSSPLPLIRFLPDCSTSSASFCGMIVHECAEDPGPADAFAALWAQSPGT